LNASPGIDHTFFFVAGCFSLTGAYCAGCQRDGMLILY
jgi:hypothetical protein